jgi:hypothetical protein
VADTGQVDSLAVDWPRIDRTASDPQPGSKAAGQVRAPEEGRDMSTPERRYGPGSGLTLGGIIVVVGILLLIFVSVVIGIIVILIGLIAFGGFARGKWY